MIKFIHAGREGIILWLAISFSSMLVMAATELPNRILAPADTEMVLIPAGSFTMGADNESRNADADEIRHTVTLTHNFYMATTETTQALWSLHAQNQSKFSGPKLPVENMTFNQVIQFANDLSKSEGLEECYKFGRRSIIWRKKYKCLGYRLPTEAEWEYAARGGLRGFGGSLQNIAWVYENSDKRTHIVAGKNPNGYGLYDMFGNVAEWVWDKYEDYATEPVVDPWGAVKSKFQVRRGGAYSTSEKFIRVSDRYALDASNAHGFLGFRLVRTAPFEN